MAGLLSLQYSSGYESYVWLSLRLISCPKQLIKFEAWECKAGLQGNRLSYCLPASCLWGWPLPPLPPTFLQSELKLWHLPLPANCKRPETVILTANPSVGLGHSTPAWWSSQHPVCSLPYSHHYRLVADFEWLAASLQQPKQKPLPYNPPSFESYFPALLTSLQSQ